MCTCLLWIIWCLSCEELKVLFKGVISHLCNDLKEYEGDGEGEAEGERELDEMTGCSPCSSAE